MSVAELLLDLAETKVTLSCHRLKYLRWKLRVAVSLKSFWSFSILLLLRLPSTVGSDHMLALSHEPSTGLLFESRKHSGVVSWHTVIVHSNETKQKSCRKFSNFTYVTSYQRARLEIWKHWIWTSWIRQRYRSHHYHRLWSCQWKLVPGSSQQWSQLYWHLLWPRSIWRHIWNLFSFINFILEPTWTRFWSYQRLNPQLRNQHQCSVVPYRRLQTR